MDKLESHLQGTPYQVTPLKKELVRFAELIGAAFTTIFVVFGLFSYGKVGVDLSRCTATIARTVRQSAGEAAFGYVHTTTGEVTPEPVPGSEPFGDAVGDELEEAAA